MNFFDIIFGTPWIVWVLLAYILFIGMKALKPHQISAPMLFIVPILLTLMKSPYITGSATNQLNFFVISGIIGLIIGFYVASRMLTELGSEKLSVRVPGNRHTLVIFMSFFCIQYFFGVIKAINQPLFQQISHIDIIVRGLFTGFLLGKAFFYTHFYFSSKTL